MKKKPILVPLGRGARRDVPARCASKGRRGWTERRPRRRLAITQTAGVPASAQAPLLALAKWRCHAWLRPPSLALLAHVASFASLALLLEWRRALLALLPLLALFALLELLSSSADRLRPSDERAQRLLRSPLGIRWTLFSGPPTGSRIACRATYPRARRRSRSRSTLPMTTATPRPCSPTSATRFSTRCSVSESGRKPADVRNLVSRARLLEDRAWSTPMSKFRAAACLPGANGTTGSFCRSASSGSTAGSCSRTWSASTSSSRPRSSSSSPRRPCRWTHRWSSACAPST